MKIVSLIENVFKYIVNIYFKYLQLFNFKLHKKKKIIFVKN